MYSDSTKLATFPWSSMPLQWNRVPAWYLLLLDMMIWVNELPKRDVVLLDMNPFLIRKLIPIWSAWPITEKCYTMRRTWLTHDSIRSESTWPSLDAAVADIELYPHSSYNRTQIRESYCMNNVYLLKTIYRILFLLVLFTVFINLYMEWHEMYRIDSIVWVAKDLGHHFTLQTYD